MSIMQTFMSTFLKTVDINKVMAHPDVREGLALARDVSANFKSMKETCERIERRLDALERKEHKSEPLRIVSGDG